MLLEEVNLFFFFDTFNNSLHSELMNYLKQVAENKVAARGTNCIRKALVNLNYIEMHPRKAGKR